MGLGHLYHKMYYKIHYYSFRTGDMSHVFSLYFSVLEVEVIQFFFFFSKGATANLLQLLRRSLDRIVGHMYHKMYYKIHYYFFRIGDKMFHVFSFFYLFQYWK